jgi:hypothetical protein
MTLTRYLAHLPRWGVEVAVALEDGTEVPRAVVGSDSTP